MASEGNDDFPEEFEKRRASSKKPFFGEIENMLHEIEKIVENEFDNFQEKISKEYIKECKLPNGGTAKEFGPFVHGYSIKIGSDGKTDIQEFGNIKKSNKILEVKEEQDPLVDIVDNTNEIRVVVELPGVEKTDIKLYGTEDSLTISVDTVQYRYYKEIKLPAKIHTKEAKSTYKNGVLEIVIPKLEPVCNTKGEPIDIN
ncbi:MAG: Hsp20/alpha crystallin family protein [Nitrososphaerota archaeon]|nr:Hsp20/alpha crystallin family protein [Nitrososphaerota archaeon]